MKIETSRLQLLPLMAEQLALATEDYEQLQKQLNLTITASALDEEMAYAMNVRRRKVLEAPDDFLWLTNWAIISRQVNGIIGFIMLKGCPNAAGEVIVGYGIDERYRRQGYATEGIKALTEWIFQNPQATRILADVEKDNEASHRLMSGLGAFKYKEDDELIWWRINKEGA
ncbi:MAG: GNAT family N-acetyltransferase [Gorillibacterium sp.]|nr:GNAT family N-acetyltransferase [Gorillibacterium sp.]